MLVTGKMWVTEAGGRAAPRRRVTREPSGTVQNSFAAGRGKANNVMRRVAWAVGTAPVGRLRLQRGQLRGLAMSGMLSGAGKWVRS